MRSLSTEVNAFLVFGVLAPALLTTGAHSALASGNLNANVDPGPNVEQQLTSDSGTLTVPRDGQSSGTLTFTLTQKSGSSWVPYANQTVTFSDGGGHFSLSASGTTDSNGNITVTATSKDINSSDATDTITASYGSGVSATASATASGLVITLTSNYQEIYESDLPNGENNAIVYASVVDHAGQDAQGTLSFSDTYGGNFGTAQNGGKLVNGQTNVSLTTGASDNSETLSDVITGSLGSNVSGTVDMKFCYALKFSNGPVTPVSVSNIATGGEAAAVWDVLDTDGSDYPSAAVSGYFNPPGGSEQSFTDISPVSGTKIAKSATITVTGSGFFEIYCTAKTGVTTPQLEFQVTTP